MRANAHCKHVPDNVRIQTIVRSNWKDAEKFSMAPAQGWHAQTSAFKQDHPNRVIREALGFPRAIDHASDEQSDPSHTDVCEALGGFIFRVGNLGWWKV